MLLRTFGWLIPLWGVAAAVILVVVVLATRHRPERRLPGVVVGLGAAWLLALLGITLLPYSFGGPPQPRMLDLMPLGTLTGGREGFAAVTLREVGANILLFVPGGMVMGWFLPHRRWTAPVTMLALAVVIETLQYVLAVGRAATVDDLIWAALGGLVGGLAGAALRPLTDRRRRPAGAPTATA